MPSHMWLGIRIVFIAAWAVAGLLQHERSPEMPLPVWACLVALVGAVLIMKAWVGPMYPRLVSGMSWVAPNWMANPFQKREPLQAFHLLAVSFIALALAMLIRGILAHGMSDAASNVAALFAGAWGVGTYLGVVGLQEPFVKPVRGKPNNSLERTREG